MSITARLGVLFVTMVATLWCAWCIVSFEGLFTSESLTSLAAALSLFFLVLTKGDSEAAHVWRMIIASLSVYALVMWCDGSTIVLGSMVIAMIITCFVMFADRIEQFIDDRKVYKPVPIRQEPPAEGGFIADVMSSQNPA